MTMNLSTQNSNAVTWAACVDPNRQTNTLVIISDHTKGLYEDKWHGNVLHYTGMGKSGDQDINFMQNRTLAKSKTNGVDVHLFEVLTASQYIYKGKVELFDEPYTETQKGEDGIPRSVWMFPVRVLLEDAPVDEEVIKEYEKEKRQQAQRLSMDDLKQRAKDSQSKIASTRKMKSTTYVRDAFVSEYVKRRADGKCQLCKEPAPFMDNVGNPYLESHHIVWLSKGGEDTIKNSVALCPNCHRKMHILDDNEDVEKLISVSVQD